MRALGPEKVGELLLSFGQDFFDTPNNTSSDDELCSLGCAVMDSAILRAWNRIEAHSAGSHLGNDASGAYVELFTIANSASVSTVLPELGDVGEELSSKLHSSLAYRRTLLFCLLHQLRRKLNRRRIHTAPDGRIPRRSHASVPRGFCTTAA